MPKYSLLLPVHNGIKYIKTCIDSILSQRYLDFELVISDNMSDDGTSEYLSSINDKRIKLFTTHTLLTQADNWSYVISKATGEWLMILGADDGITPYFFYISDYLTSIADRKHLNLIKSNRIYYFWEDSRFIYGDNLCTFSISPKTIIKKTSTTFYEALYDCSKFYDIPQMYTTSFFRRNVITQFKKNNTIKYLINYNSPDAYLGTLACITEKKYLYSELPLGWVGSSVSSQGLKDSTVNKKVYLTKDESLSFSAQSYKSINCTNLLLAGSYLTLKNLNFNSQNKYNIDINKLLKASQKDILKSNSKDRYLYFEHFLTYFYNVNLSLSSISIKDKIYFFIKKIYNKYYNIFICKKYESIFFHYSYNDVKYSLYDINSIIKNNQNIYNLLLKYKIIV